MKTIAPNIAIPIVKPIAFETLNTLERKSESGRIGSAARVPHQKNRASRATPATPNATSGAEDVDLVPDGRRVQVEPRDDNQHRERTDRQVHVEDPAPREVVHEEAAEQ